MKMILSLALLLVLAAAIILQGEQKTTRVLLPGLYLLALAAVAGLSMYGARLVYAAPYGASNAATPSAQAPVPAEEDIHNGEIIFASNCQGCHPRGTNTVVPELPLKEAKQLESFESFQDFVHDPRLPDGSPGPMPDFPPERLSDRQDRQLYAYIRSMLEDPAWQ
jgi:mono/diheme cytochrome c family protein